MTNGWQLARRRFWTSIETITGILFVMTLLVMFIQVTARYALSVAVPWTDEASRFSFIAMVFVGAALCQRSGEQVRITILLDVLPVGLRKVLESLSDVLTVLIGIALIIGATRNAVSTSNVQAATLPMSFAWLYVIQGFGIFLLILIAGRDAISRFTTSRAEGTP